MILHDKSQLEFRVEFSSAPNRAKFYCVCDYCGLEFLRDKKTIIQCNLVINKDSCGKGLCKKTKSEEVNMKKYGVKNIGGNKEKLDKRKLTNKQKYGEEEYLKSNHFKDQIKLDYGVDHPSQSEKIKDKIKNTRIDNFGVDHHTKSLDYQKSQKKKSIDKYGVDHYSKTDEFKDKLAKTNLEKYGLSSFFKTDYYQNLIKNKYDSSTTHYGKTQREISDFLLNLGYKFEPDRTLLSGKEIDLYNKDLKLGIEYCGLFWHNELSPQPRNCSYHYSKYETCLKQGIKLITIFEDEWKSRRIQCEGVLKSMISFNKRIFARKCDLRSINFEDLNYFCEEYHIRGKPKFTNFACGLYFENNLIGVMSLGKHHRKSSSFSTILTRMCFKRDYQVIGGASRLLNMSLNWARSQGYENIISWSDNRWSAGTVYDRMGFSLDSNLPPDYSYVLLNGGKPIRLSKQSCKKKNKGCPEGKTEREWMVENGW